MNRSPKRCSLGEDFKRLQREQFAERQTQDLAVMTQADLVTSMPEAFAQGYVCKLERGVTVASSDNVSAIAIGNEVAVVRDGVERIGSIRGTEKECGTLANAATKLGRVTLRVDDVSPLGFCRVWLVKEVE